ncbi:hypothetical protein B5S28_g4719 [[Candida] boidinii]|nr:hypothetical protein B5S28_g4719 [[Candida] boidinii]OWB64065.1 hypothetical protein B5S29_g5098 [[Candida] boidinii]
MLKVLSLRHSRDYCFKRTRKSISVSFSRSLYNFNAIHNTTNSAFNTSNIAHTKDERAAVSAATSINYMNSNKLYDNKLNVHNFIDSKSTGTLENKDIIIHNNNNEISTSLGNITGSRVNGVELETSDDSTPDLKAQLEEYITKITFDSLFTKNDKFKYHSDKSSHHNYSLNLKKFNAEKNTEENAVENVVSTKESESTVIIDMDKIEDDDLAFIRQNEEELLLKLKMTRILSIIEKEVYYLDSQELQTDFLKRIFKKNWMTTNQPVENPIIENQKQFENIINNYSSFKYLNNSHKCLKIVKNLMFSNDPELSYFRNLNCYIYAIELASSKNDFNTVTRLIEQMQKIDNIKPDPMIYNVILKQTLKKTDNLQVRLTIIEETLEFMNKINIKLDKVTLYIIFSILPPNQIKEQLNKIFKFLNLSNNSIYHELIMSDLILKNKSANDLSTYLNTVLKDNEEKIEIGSIDKATIIDINLINFILFKYLSQDEFINSWKFLHSLSYKQFDILPKSSTITLFLTYAINKNNLILSLYIINSFLLNFKKFNPLAINRILKTFLINNYNKKDNNNNNNINEENDDGNNGDANLMTEPVENHLPIWWSHLVKVLCNMNNKFQLSKARKNQTINERLIEVYNKYGYDYNVNLFARMEQPVFDPYKNDKLSLGERLFKNDLKKFVFEFDDDKNFSKLEEILTYNDSYKSYRKISDYWNKSKNDAKIHRLANSIKSNEKKLKDLKKITN